jgi:hypothetical protein
MQSDRSLPFGPSIDKMTSVRSMLPRSTACKRTVTQAQRLPFYGSTIAAGRVDSRCSISSSSVAASASAQTASRVRYGDLAIRARTKTSGSGVKRLHVAVPTGIHSVVHTLAVVREIEARFGPVIEVKQMRVRS